MSAVTRPRLVIEQVLAPSMEVGRETKLQAGKVAGLILDEVVGFFCPTALCSWGRRSL
jgi:hypothetical protein